MWIIDWLTRQLKTIAKERTYMGCKVVFNRSWQRGKQLDEDCKKAKISKNEYGINDNRLFCFGLVDTSIEEPLNKCLECRAFVHNSKPLK